MESQPVIVASDRELADAVLRRGDERAFRELYRRHTPRLMAMLFRLLGGARDDAEDAVQETWIKACEGLGKCRWEAAFSTWLAGIGINVARDCLRRRGRSRVVAVERPPESPAEVRGGDERIDLDRSIARLPHGCREVFTLYEITGMRHREIAAALGISEGTSKSQLSAARAMMRGYLSEPINGDEP